MGKSYRFADVKIQVVDDRRTITFTISHENVNISTHIPPTQFVILKALLQRSDHLVPVEDIVRALGWQQLSKVDQKMNLHRQISHLRHRLRPHLKIITSHDEYELLGYSLSPA